jgi:hypothetical protein
MIEIRVDESRRGHEMAPSGGDADLLGPASIWKASEIFSRQPLKGGFGLLNRVFGEDGFGRPPRLFENRV